MKQKYMNNTSLLLPLGHIFLRVGSPCASPSLYSRPCMFFLNFSKKFKSWSALEILEHISQD
jgi:hypothetical protein